MTIASKTRLDFVSSVSNVEVFRQRLLASECLCTPQGSRHRLHAIFNAPSAAHAFHAALEATRSECARFAIDPAQTWLVWVHQDVFLPAQWDAVFLRALHHAQAHYRKLALVGVYGHTPQGARAGHLMDRGSPLKEPTLLPAEAASLDELLFAMRIDATLQLDPALGFDFYATDLVLQAQNAGYQCAILDAYCEHWSDSPHEPNHAPAALLERIVTNGTIFEQKWAQRLPIETPSHAFTHLGSIRQRIEAALPHPIPADRSIVPDR